MSDGETSRAEDYWCVKEQGRAPHPGFSCLCPGDKHLVFSKQLSNEEWSAFKDRVDETFNPHTKDWDAEAMVALMEEVAGAYLVQLE